MKSFVFTFLLVLTGCGIPTYNAVPVADESPKASSVTDAAPSCDTEPEMVVTLPSGIDPQSTTVAVNVFNSEKFVPIYQNWQDEHGQHYKFNLKTAQTYELSVSTKGFQTSSYQFEMQDCQQQIVVEPQPSQVLTVPTQNTL